MYCTFSDKHISFSSFFFFRNLDFIENCRGRKSQGELIDIAGLPQVIVAVSANKLHAAFVVDAVVTAREYLTTDLCQISGKYKP